MTLKNPDPVKAKSKFTNNTNAAGTSYVQIAVSFKYLINFWETLELVAIS